MKKTYDTKAKKVQFTPKVIMEFGGDMATPAIEQHMAVIAAMNTQIGGDHYKKLAIQPIEYIHKNQIGFVEGSVIKYVSRWKNKNGVEDLKKARHLLDILIEMEGGR
jgi:hypothetical protein